MARLPALVCCVVLLLCVWSGVVQSGEAAETFAATVAPSSVTMGLEVSVTVSGLVGAGDVFYTEEGSCDTASVGDTSATPEAGEVSFTLTPSTAGTLLFCQTEGDDGEGGGDGVRAVTYTQVATVTVVKATLSPTSTGVSEEGQTFTITGASLTVLTATGGSVFVATGKDITCTAEGATEDAKVTVAVTPDGNSATFQYVPSTAGDYTVCLVTNTVATSAGSFTVASSGGSDGPNIQPVTVDPGVPITDTGIDTSTLEKPFLSKSATCDDPLPDSVFSTGYLPSFDEDAKFFVCATEISNPSESPVTTPAPTLTVKNWEISPRSVLSQYNAVTGVAQNQSVTISSKVPGENIYFSTATSCTTSSLGSASDFNETLEMTVSFVNAHGLVYVCLGQTEGNSIPIAAFLSVSPPMLSSTSLAVMNGVSFTGKLEVWTSADNPSGLYSMTQGADAGFSYASYYVNETREVFLSSDSCKTTLEGTSQTSVGDDDTISIPNTELPADLTQVYLCTGTPAGTGVAAIIPYTDSAVYPTTFFAGLSASIYIPGHPSSTLDVFSSTTRATCGAAGTGITNVQTDTAGLGTLSLAPSGSSEPAVGSYIICSGTDVVATVEVVAPLQYEISGSIFVVGVPSVVNLKANLTSGVLINGVTTTGDCSAASSEFGSWKSVQGNAIELTAAKSTDSAQLCARVEENQTVAVVPGGTAKLTFTTSTLALPEDGLTCGTNKITNCVGPGASSPTTTQVLAVIYGACCNTEDRENALAETPAGDGDCEVSLSSDETERYPSEAVFSLCAYDTADASYCVTVASNLSVSGCSSSSSNTTVIIIVVCVVVGCLLLFAVIGYFVWRRWFRKTPEAEEQ